ncbi:transporter substrate-binding domain-containing protein [Duganella sp. FT135W]|uniref:Transporter substrate-binding domain-containing protein n=1 Tax=Duganella flavida TaxID=2692175 RepID=A0A6L8K7J1_9BURK|nr:transporter substrate-binding domain-containing protein [Duganella flavida]MYM21822.1 transporter substrate-binding domain-containing protein [Duganella flavida]
MPRCWPVLPAIAIALCAPALAQGPDTLIFGTTHDPETVVYSYALEYLEQLCAEVRQRCQLRNLPGRRGSAMLADGSIAGEVGRVRQYNEKRPEYHRVEEAFITSRTFVFTRTSRPAISSWAELANKARTISYKRGVYIYQQRLEAMWPNVQPHDVQSVPACLEMVLAGRDQACVFDDGSLNAQSRALLRQGHIGKQLDEFNLYIYLGKDYALLAPSLTEAARRLNAQGLNARLQKKYFISP